ncbi:MAG: ribonuclease J [Rhodospirillales bacterium]|nr:ribonuclease J [Rhodospirillales bacterium]
MTRRDDGLYFLPLGGSGEIGMNLNLYRYRGKWLMVDLGVTFGDGTSTGVDVITPDPTFIAENREDLIGLVLTHAHEDHLGAVQYLWPMLRCPIYATGFTATFLKLKLAETDFGREVPIHEIEQGSRLKLGDFEIELLHITHSIPEPNALAIRTPAGTVLHTGDWKLDTGPVVGPVTDADAFRRVGEEGVLALVGDSTNATKEGTSGSEESVAVELEKLIAQAPHRVAVACFASNVARLETVARAAKKAGRECALVGRSLWRILEAAQDNGYLRDLPPFLTESDAGYVPRDRILMICTGSQGEPRAALSRIAVDEHPHVVLEEGDWALFSSRTIPGNEKPVGQLQNQLMRLGVKVITDREAAIHVSGHPCRDELSAMYQWIRPRIAIPVHGEQVHMEAHAELARACQVKHTLVPANGDLIRLDGAEGPRVVERVQAGRWAVDGDRLLPMDGAVVRGRAKLLWNGAVVATVVVDRKGRLMSDPRVSAPGLIDPEDPSDELAEDLVEAVRGAVAKCPDKAPDATLAEAARRAVRKLVSQRRGKKPIAEIHVVRL